MGSAEQAGPDALESIVPAAGVAGSCSIHHSATSETLMGLQSAQ